MGKTHLVVVVSALLAAGAACSGGGKSGGGGGSLSVTGAVADGSGWTLEGASVTDVQTGAAVQSDYFGEFTVSAAPVKGPDGVARALLRVEAPGYAPQLVAVPVKPQQGAYRVNPKLVPLTTVSVVPGVPTQIQTQAMGHSVQVSFGPVSASGLKVVYAVIDPANAPGVLRDANATPDKALRSGGMFYVNLLDANDNPVTPPPNLQVSMGAFLPASIPEADPMQAYALNAGGMWASPQAAGQPANGMQWNPAQFGFWNADGNYRTACVKGVISSNGAACKGGRVSATGPDGLSSFDSSGADGSFCVTGAQTWGSQLNVAGATFGVTMPATAGDCTVPASCRDIGVITVSAGACAPGECSPPCGAGQSCLNGVCVNDNSCAGRCCPGRDDSCTLPNDSCFCDAYCTTAGDCCPDYTLSCQ